MFADSVLFYRFTSWWTGAEIVQSEGEQGKKMSSHISNPKEDDPSGYSCATEILAGIHPESGWIPYRIPESGRWLTTNALSGEAASFSSVDGVYRVGLMHTVGHPYSPTVEAKSPR